MVTHQYVYGALLFYSHNELSSFTKITQTAVPISFTVKVLYIHLIKVRGKRQNHNSIFKSQKVSIKNSVFPLFKINIDRLKYWVRIFGYGFI